MSNLYASCRFYPYLFSAFCLVGSIQAALAQSGDKNYSIARTYKRAVTSPSGNVQDATQNVSYFDGLGRPLQTVAAHASPQVNGSTPSDLVSHTEYDGFGRVWKTFLPAPAQGNGGYQGGAASNSLNYYNNGGNVCNPNGRGFAETQYEPSPLNRVSRQYGGGTDRAVEFSYGSNGGGEVKRYHASGNTLNQDGDYDGSQLTYVEAKDENGNRAREFKDKDGKVVLKRVYKEGEDLSTYYVYDDLNQLKFVLQPKYQEDGNADKHAFKYEYDDRGRMTKKYIPGGGTTTMSYNDRDLLTESTDGRSKTTYYKYDDLNRVTETGEKIGGNEEALTRTHYDNYNPSFGNKKDFVNENDDYPGGYRNDVRGQVTVTATRVMNPDGGYGPWLYATTYYDERYRVIQILRDVFDLGGQERTTRKVDFGGKVEKERITQSVSTGTNRVEKFFSYDHADRLLSVRYVVKKDNDVKKDVVLSAARYDAIGQLKTKWLHSADGGSTFREQLDYCFIPRGWMRRVTGKTGAGENFGVELRYDDPSQVGAQYNGNIAEMRWRQGTGSWVGYKFNYDQANRLTNAEGIDGNPYQESIPGYDKNGNITALTRKNGGSTWDNLGYSYDGNRLKKVTDNGGSGEGFSNGSSGDNDDYAYDGNGNATQDLNKGINPNGLEYNLLNLVRRVSISGKTLEYHYDATGAKLRMSNSNGAVNTKYAGAFEYNEQNYLVRIATEEGQITVAGSNYEMQYYLKDHLGNTRMVLTEGGTVIQETEYFAFGLAIPRSGIGVNKYLYNGKEIQPEIGWIDYGARMYDGILGMWFNVDPLASEFSSYSPYNFSLNNPIRLIDPDGRSPFDVIIKGTEKQAAFNELQASVKGQLNLSMDANGKVSYTQVGTEKLSKDAQQLTTAINDNSVVVNINAENTTNTQSGKLYIGGAFSGNTVTKGANGNTVVAEQEVNPGVLNKVSTAHGKPGADILHEVTEAYQGGLISQKSGVSSPASNQSGSVYQRAHNRATNQSGQIFERIYDASGNEMQMSPSGGYPTGVKGADWYVNDRKGNKVVDLSFNCKSTFYNL